MPTISFKIKDVIKLVKSAEERAKKYGLSATNVDIFNGDLYPEGKPLDKQGRSEDQLSAEEYFWPSSDYIDKSNLKLQLILVGDQGLYLMTNALIAEGESHEVVYAKGCDPHLDDDFYENKIHLFGGDDGTEVLPIDWLTLSEKNNKRVFSISLSSTSVKVNL